MKNESIFAPGAPAAVGPYSHAVKAGKLLFTCGQLGLDPDTGALMEGVQAQARQALANLKTVLEAAGMGMEDVVKTTVFLANMGDFPTVNALYAEAFGETKPARSCVAVAALPMGALFEIEAIARKA
ncbi:MAG: Rid family detoxifying hydrolase [Firmicutes bacterium]|nr:Rid family detoxifying hydrolase [Bacillota bacterium]